ncbi:hypothetical protein HHK36_027961 [Tetracentron sinense]|uniref:Uncharacterized protein n=1 Tax=Tetracentron sinense TaxID=13715 RepID=A0A834YK53_TETSI|nr:hypothetical protein HHK36_027961 [Tetracentron sinense]
MTHQNRRSRAKRQIASGWVELRKEARKLSSYAKLCARFTQEVPTTSVTQKLARHRDILNEFTQGEVLELYLREIDVSFIGGHAGVTITPLLSRADFSAGRGGRGFALEIAFEDSSVEALGLTLMSRALWWSDTCEWVAGVARWLKLVMPKELLLWELRGSHPWKWDGSLLEGGEPLRILVLSPWADSDVKDVLVERYLVAEAARWLKLVMPTELLLWELRGSHPRKWERSVIEGGERCEFRQIKGNINSMKELAKLLSSVRDDISEYKTSGSTSPRMHLLRERERAAIHGSIGHVRLKYSSISAFAVVYDSYVMSGVPYRGLKLSCLNDLMIDDMINQAQTTRLVLGSQRTLFGAVQGKVKQLSDKFPIIHGLLAILSGFVDPFILSSLLKVHVNSIALGLCRFNSKEAV